MNNRLEIRFKNKKYNISLFREGRAVSLLDIMRDDNVRIFEYSIDGSDKNTGHKGNYSLWFPLKSSIHGMKIIYNNNREKISFDVDTRAIEIIKNSKSPIFPSISEHGPGESVSPSGNRKCYIIFMDKLKSQSSKIVSKPKGAKDLLECSLEFSDLCSKEFKRLDLFPDDVWYKSMNIASGKIIDFHAFRYMPERYRFKYNLCDKKVLNNIYANGPRWTTKKSSVAPVNESDTLYQGYVFEDGYEMIGYKSDKNEYDSYRKLPFIPFMSKVNNKRVLDIGCNQGFFTFQMANHGAKEVVSLEYEKKHYDFTKEMNDKCFGFKNVNIIHTDAVKYLDGLPNKKQFDTLICLSVIHQIYPNMNGAGKFLDKMASIAEVSVIESPIKHKLHNLGIVGTYNILKKHFQIVRLLYFYDAYSGGKRAIYQCYGKGDVTSLPRFI